MGFFSKIKTLFTSDENISSQTSKNYDEEISEVKKIKNKLEEGKVSKISQIQKIENELLAEEEYELAHKENEESKEVLSEKNTEKPSTYKKAISYMTNQFVDSKLSTESEPEEEQIAYEIIDNSHLIVALRESEQKLSAWLKIVLQGVNKKGDLLNSRLYFLLNSLEIPKSEIHSFITDFNSWLDRMEYSLLEEFKSELQYRLSLALELEDEEDERSRLILKLNSSLSKTREHLLNGLQNLFSQYSALDNNFWDELEELFIMSDMGYEAAQKLIDILKKVAITHNIETPQDLLPHFSEELAKLFTTPKRISAINPPEVILMVGVNGVGKTTTIAKLAYRERMQGKKVLIVAADTFRAAAIEQLGVWAKRIGVDFYSKQHGSDPAAVAYEAMEKGLAGGGYDKYDTIFIDTAGRLHTKTGLMDELTKIRNVINKKHEGSPHRTILTIDATTGQNALQQTKLFSESAQVSEIILTKLDGTAKGGVALAIATLFQIPITYIGLGEKLEDLRPFNAKDFAEALFELKK